MPVARLATAWHGFAGVCYETEAEASWVVAIVRSEVVAIRGWSSLTDDLQMFWESLVVFHACGDFDRL